MREEGTLGRNRRCLPVDWKIIAALVVAVAIVVSGFLASGGVNFSGTDSLQAPAQNPQSGSDPIGNFLTGAKDTVSNFLTGTTSEKNVNRTLQVSGLLSMEDDVLNLNTPASSVVLEFSTPTSINIGSERIDFSEGTKVTVGNFVGKLDIYSNSTAIIDGNAETIYVSDIGILPHTQKTVSMKTATNLKSIKIYNASSDSLNFNATGILDTGQGKVAIKVGSEPVQVENFKGDLDISGADIKMEGLSTRVLLNKEKVSIG